MVCQKCKTEPQHGSCLCDEQYVKDLEAQVARLESQLSYTSSQASANIVLHEEQVAELKKMIVVSCSTCRHVECDSCELPCADCNVVTHTKWQIKSLEK